MPAVSRKIFIGARSWRQGLRPRFYARSPPCPREMVSLDDEARARTTSAARRAGGRLPRGLPDATDELGRIRAVGVLRAEHHRSLPCREVGGLDVLALLTDA